MFFISSNQNLIFLDGRPVFFLEVWIRIRSTSTRIHNSATDKSGDMSGHCFLAELSLQSEFLY